MGVVGGGSGVRGETLSARGAQFTALTFAVAGLLFLLYPAIRPFSDEASLAGAEAFASNAWLVAHSLAMVAFILLVLGLFGLWLRLRPGGRLATFALLLGWNGVGLTLPYYGAETFGLHAVGQEALRQHNAALLSMANAIRWELGIWFLLTGLAALGVGTVLFAIALWRFGSGPRWSGLPLAAGFGLYIPQFGFGEQVRLAHGALVLAGCLVLAWVMWRPVDAVR